MASVSQVAAGELDPTWLGGVFEVVEEGQDGPLVHGMRLVSYRKVVGRDRVVLVGENTSVVVESSVGLAFHVAAAVPGRFTGAVVAGAPAPAPAAMAQHAVPVQQQVAVAQHAVPVGGYPPTGQPGPVTGPGPGAVPVAGPGPVPGAGGVRPVGTPPAPGRPVAPWMRKPPTS
ncbi:hypothetical protein AB0D08_38290 [Kitasatospora sp. NPDC048540]|uniref:hypothetical protein n=1 Tax=Kitasatospora sp. NPDC048540 TaxID=3155634 RepID=UPI0033DAA8AD